MKSHTHTVEVVIARRCDMASVQGNVCELRPVDELRTLSRAELVAYVKRLGLGLRGARSKRAILERLRVENEVRRTLSGLRDGATP